MVATANQPTSLATDSTVTIAPRETTARWAPLADVVESLFQAETTLAGEFCQATRGASWQCRWRLTLTAAEALLDEFELAPDARRRLAERLTRELAATQRASAMSRASLFRRFGELIARQDSSTREREQQQRARAAIAANRAAMAPAIARLRRAEAAGEAGIRLEMVLVQLLHTRVNLLLRSAAETQELAIYEVLVRREQQRSARWQARRLAAQAKLVLVRFAAGGAVGLAALGISAPRIG